MKKHYYAGKSSIGINCSYESLNGTAWTAYKFDSKEARDAWVLKQNGGYIGGPYLVATEISAADAKRIGIEQQ